MSERYAAESHFMPYPELLTESAEPYDIIDSRSVRGLPTNGMVDQVNRVMLVPFDTPGRVVSRHECGHVLWTEVGSRPKRGAVAYAQAAEDGRINRGLEVIGLPIELDSKELGEVVRLGERDLQNDDEGLAMWALRTVASFGTNAAQPLLDLIDGECGPRLPFKGVSAMPLPHRVHSVVVRAHTKIEKARLRAGGPVADAAYTRTLARWLRRELGALGLPEIEGGGGGLVCCLGAGSGLRKGRGRGWRSRGLLGRGDGAKGGPGAGRMTIAEPELPHPTVPSARGIARGRRSSDEGTVLRDISRFAHDKQVFGIRTRNRRGGGSVLIDVSGSMSLSAEDIDKLIAKAPSATLVAIYSGRDDEGELRVVVRDGRRIGVDGLEPFGPSNVIDLPALEWLAKQPGPRVWISDGAVTGVNDRPSRKVKVGCMQVCRRAAIERFDDAASAAKFLAGRH